MDRELNLRQLLHFGGLKSIPYYTGIMLAEHLIFSVTASFLVFLGFICQAQVFRTSSIEFIISLILFGFALINLCNVIGFMFNNSKSAFKSVSIFLLIFSLVVMLLHWISSEIAK